MANALSTSVSRLCPAGGVVSMLDASPISLDLLSLLLLYLCFSLSLATTATSPTCLSSSAGLLLFLVVHLDVSAANALSKSSFLNTP